MHIPSIKTLVTLPKTLIKRVTDGTIDEFVKDFEVSEETLKSFGLTKQEAYLLHSHNPAHLYCRLRDIGMDKVQAKELVKVYEQNIYKGIQKFIDLRKKQQHSKIEERTICLHQAFIRNRPLGEGYGDCLVCEPDTANNPTCRGYYPFKIYSFEGEKKVQPS